MGVATVSRMLRDAHYVERVIGRRRREVIEAMDRYLHLGISRVAEEVGVSKGFASRVYGDFLGSGIASEVDGRIASVCRELIPLGEYERVAEVLRFVEIPTSDSDFLWEVPEEFLSYRLRIRRVLAGVLFGRVGVPTALREADRLVCECTREGLEYLALEGTLLKMNLLALLRRHDEVMDLYERSFRRLNLRRLPPHTVVFLLGVLGFSAPSTGRDRSLRRLIRESRSLEQVSPRMLPHLNRARTEAMINLGEVRRVFSSLNRLKLPSPHAILIKAAVLSSLLRREILDLKVPDSAPPYVHRLVAHFVLVSKIVLGFPVSEEHIEEAYPNREGMFFEMYHVAKLLRHASKGQWREVVSTLKVLADAPTESTTTRIVRAALTGRTAHLRLNVRERIAKMWLNGRLKEAVRLSEDKGLLLHLNFLAALRPYPFREVAPFHRSINVRLFSLKHRMEVDETGRVIYIDGVPHRFRDEAIFRDALNLLRHRVQPSPSTCRYLRRKLGSVFIPTAEGVVVGVEE